ncbi:helix-turn-helix domain-containing protein [Streptomyces sp. SCUT-3]|nr:helix-turn-helix transcriptional regulator [Streptomyces sp. SCUT-3]PLW74150.1 transcriptional regulator [Streptomyces sp. DJ]QMV21955.1 helix-turn-helix domain-containing protein [Streptomyces sp. SCUT-3]
MVNIRNLDSGSSVLAFFGAELRRLREAAGLTQKQLGEVIYCTGSLVGQIETARKPPTREFTERADAGLGAEGALLRLWPLVSRNSLPPWFREFAELEATATTICTFQSQLVHGLLQTEEYARAVFSSYRPQNLEQKVTARMERQRILQRADPPVLWLVLDEAVLRRPVGGAGVMYAQLARLLECLSHPLVHVQVLPAAVGEHPGLLGSFTVLTFDDTPDIAYSESYEAGQVIINPQAVKARSLRYDLLRATALSPQDSADLIADAMEDLHGQQSGPDRSTVA